MTRDDIIRMAMKAGFSSLELEIRDAGRLQNFAALVAAAEREACAMLAYNYQSPDQGGSWRESIAAAIRARSKQ